jgi:hypothetical protein
VKKFLLFQRVVYLRSKGRSLCRGNLINPQFEQMEHNGKVLSQLLQMLLRPDASDLTARPWDDFEAMKGWIDLAAIPVKAGAAGFWYCMQQWTYDRHFNRNIWRIDMKEKMFLNHDGTRAVAGEPLPDTSPCFEPDTVDASAGAASGVDADTNGATSDALFFGPPPAGQRFVAVRELQRKTPSPCGGGPDGTAPCHTADEWTAQYESPVGGHQTAIFGLVIPKAACANNNPRCVPDGCNHIHSSRVPLCRTGLT